eukprot:2918367-Amphidinium_carterae.1
MSSCAWRSMHCIAKSQEEEEEAAHFKSNSARSRSVRKQFELKTTLFSGCAIWILTDGTTDQNACPCKIVPKYKTICNIL